jgi:outer membrane protein TolC
MPPSEQNAPPTTAESELNDLLQSSGTDLPTKALTQTQAIAKALGQNFDIQVKTYDVNAAQAVVRQAHGTFDPVFNAEGSYEDIRDPQDTQDFVATGGTPLEILNGDPRIFVENNQHYKLSLDGKLPIGTQYELKTQLDVLSNTLDKTSPLALFTPEFQSFTGVTIDQPFLRGFGTDVNNAEIRASIVNKLVSRYELEDQMLGTVSQVLQSYNQLSYLTEELEAKRQDRQLGIELVEDRIKSLERGQISSRELNRAESSLAEIIEDYTKAQDEVINQQAILQALISNQSSDLGQFTYLPVSPMPRPQLHQSVEELLVEALTHRPKYLEAKSKVEEENIKLVYAENQKWPQLDLKGTYGVNGLSSSFGNSYYREIVPQGPQWTVGLLFSIPFGNNEAGGKYDEEIARKEQSLLAMKQIELNTDLVIRKLVATIQANQYRLTAMHLFSKTAGDNYDEEQTRLEKGLSTDLDVLKYHRDFTEAHARERAAEVDLDNAFVQLQEVTGTLLDNNHVHVVP